MTPTETPVARLVHGPAVTVGMDDLAEAVHEAMRKRRRRFAAVVQGGSVTAVLDRARLADRLAAKPDKEVELRVRDVVHPGMACLPGDATLDAANRLLRATGSAAVPVLDEHHRLLGLITAEQVDRELRRRTRA